MRYQVRSYLDFLFRSTNEHGVHSPFVFDLATSCLYDKTPYAEYRILREYRKALLQDTSAIEVTDFGAGSRVFKSDTRQIAKIAKTAGITAKRSELLFRTVRHFKPESMLEIGTSVGLATSALSLGNPGASITTIEGCPETAAVAKKQFERFGLKNIHGIVAEFESFLQQAPANEHQLVYFDGNHQKEATLRYFDLLLPTAANDAVWIFDDIHWSPQMLEAWETIKKHPAVTVTIDTYRWGFVFFRKEQEKEHFSIRI